MVMKTSFSQSKKAPWQGHGAVVAIYCVGGDLLSHLQAVPSAQKGLTSLFGMGRGEPLRCSHQQVLGQRARMPGIRGPAVFSQTSIG